MRHRAAGWVLLALTGLLSVPSLWIAATNPAPAVPVRTSLEAQTSLALVSMVVVITLTFSLVGAVIVSNRPGNGLGWLFTAGGVFVALVMLSFTYGYRAIAADPGSLPAGRFGAWLGDIMYVPVLGLFSVFLFLLFPDGHLRTRAHRRTAIVASIGIGLGTLGGILEPTLADYRGIATPLELEISPVVSWTFLALGFAMLLGTVAASITLLVRRLRRAIGQERDQLRILVFASVVASVMFLPSFVLPLFLDWFQTQAAWAIAGAGVLLVPVSVGVAILRHRLLDIDVVIRRTVIVALLGAFITAVYVAIVVGVGTLVGNRASPVLSAAAAALVALAFQPVLRRARRVANRLVYGERATPYEVLSALADRMGETYGVSDLLPRIARVVAEGTGARRTAVWLRVGEELRAAAVWPTGDAMPVVSVPGDRLPPLPTGHAVPVRHQGELLGALSLDKLAEEPLSSTEEKLLGDVASQSGLALRNVRLTEELRELVEELRASRQRLVKVQDQERRKLERDIHDGAQQQLIALQVKQRLAEQLAQSDPATAKELLRQLQTETSQALEELRDLARGIYPPLLADEGLPAALGAQARKAGMRVEVKWNEVGRFPQEVEATVYFCCLEALQNAAKYAEASAIRITLGTTDGELTFEVADDGQGFDPATGARGTGLQNMTDRLDAIGGSLQITSAPGDGTRVLGRIPIREVATA